MFDDVYRELSPRLEEQRAALDAEIEKHGPKIPPHSAG
jgi:hypothetical protein